MTDVVQLRVGEYRIGIIGLTEVIEAFSKTHAQASDEEVTTELVKDLSRRNYIPPNMKEAFGKAFLREFKRVTGRTVEEEERDAPPSILNIQVLGPGCFQCNRLEALLREVLSDLKKEVLIDHVTDIKEISKYGVMGTPALVINGNIKAVGIVPSKDQLRGWLVEFPIDNQSI